MPLRIYPDKPFAMPQIEVDHGRGELRIGHEAGWVVCPLSNLGQLARQLTALDDKLAEERREERLYEDVQ